MDVPGKYETRTEIGINWRWAQQNQTLLGNQLLDLLETRPLEEWNISIRKSEMPGEQFKIVATRKE